MIYFLLLIIGIFLTVLRIDSVAIQNVYALICIIAITFYIATVSPLHSYDTIAYQLYYTLPPITHRFEIGYMELSYFFFTHGCSYQFFRFVMTLCFQFLMFLGVRKFTNNLVLFYVLYMIFPFFIDSGQVRFNYMFCLVLFALGFLKKFNIKSVVLSICLIIISSLFQVSGLVYLLVPLLYLVQLKKLLRFTDVLLIVFAFIAIVMRILPLNNLVGNLLTMAMQISGRSGADHYVELYSQGSSMSVIIFYILSLVFTYILFRKYLVDISKSTSENVQKILLATFLVGILFIPALIASGDFERFMRCSIVIFSIVVSIYLDPSLHRTIENTIKHLLIIFALYAFITFSWRYWTEDGGMIQFLPYIIHMYS